MSDKLEKSARLLNGETMQLHSVHRPFALAVSGEIAERKKTKKFEVLHKFKENHHSLGHRSFIAYVSPFQQFADSSF